MIKPNTNPAELARQLAEVETEIAQFKPIDGFLEDLGSLRSQLVILDTKISFIEYNNSGSAPSVKVIESKLEELRGFRAHAPTEVERLRFSVVRLNAGIAGSDVVGAIHAEMDGWNDLLQTSEAKEQHLTETLTKARADLKQLQTQRKAVVREIERMENFITEARNNHESDFTGHA